MAHVSKEKQANGEEGVTNGASTGETSTKTLEEIAKEPKKSVFCYSCGIDCTRVRFHYAKNAPNTTASQAKQLKYDLCPNCFMEGRYPNSHGAVEFVKLEDTNYSALPDRDAPWTNAELLLLLEGLEMFDDNWDSISDHVRTRTREECVMKFLQLEIEDKFLDEGPNGPISYGALNYGRAPFTQADNPVMSVVSFLAGMAEPSVAAAAANKSVDEMRKKLRSQIENGTSPSAASQDSKGKEKEGLKTEDSMDIDPPAVSPKGDARNQVTRLSNDSNSRSQSQNPSSSAATLPTIALATSAARAASLASHEEREMTRLVSSAVNLTLQKFELKMAQFSEMEAVLQAERRELERGRQALFLERLSFKRKMRDVMEGLKRADLRGGEEGGRMAKEVLSGALGGAGKLSVSADGERGGGVGPVSADEGGRMVEI